MSTERRIEAVLHAFAIWTLSAALLIGSMILMANETAVAIRLITAPLIGTIVASVFFNKYEDARPLPVAAIFAATVAALDAIVLAVVVQRSAALFLQPLATWIPYALIFAATWASGAFMVQPPAPAPRA